MPGMRRALLRRVGEPLEIGTAAVPEPGPGEILIRVAACGVCHSDLHAVDGDWGEPPKMPLIPGHEATGHVVAHGRGVDRPALGAAVGVPWMAGACGRCAWCRAGMETICPEGGATGFSCDGGYAEYMVARADFVGLIPDGVDLVRIAPILCAGVTTYRGLRRSEARAGDFVAIVGAGGLGHVAVQYARAMGFRPIVLDVDPAKLDLARRLGAEAVIAAGPDAAGAVTALTGGGAAAAIVTAPAPAAFEQSLALIRPGGTAVFIGLPGGERDAIRLSIAAISNWEKSIRGSNVGTRQDLQEAVDFAARGLVTATVETVPLEQVNEALARLRRGQVAGRLVLDLGGEGAARQVDSKQVSG
ncbi:alcohol dehydrogenase catalytic domain-containing protein [Inquilinus sp. NPDC058860]|uniref:alcohol dehydrogenase catalytic domain-containing protein n=1 Tax=Inquilinus sp. NPDC058860 TaxID=3346652 RepID=UPI00369E1D52